LILSRQQSLRSRFSDRKVEVISADATAMPFVDGQFSAPLFTMLHHVPSSDMQDKLRREVWRVIEPGGLFVGSDSLQSLLMPLIHLGDTPLPVDPNTFCARLEAAGFQVLKIEKNSEAFPFQARRLSARR
jgi:ubiquinone/menaquinone biosynthesis C-methylase UbiE